MVASDPGSSSGAFRYAVAGGGAIALVAARVGGGVSPPVVTDGASQFELVIGAGATLAGRVVTAGGAPAPKATVALVDETVGTRPGLIPRVITRRETRPGRNPPGSEPARG